MAVIAPQTDIYLLKVPLEISDMNQLTFTNATAQYNYFNSLPKLQVNDYSYQRKDGTIRYGGNFDEVLTYNYCMYRNDAYSNKWFYAYITDIQYLSDNSTAISIKTDCWQTWQFDLTFKPCLIDREHTNDDTVGANTLPEGLELGEFVVNNLQEDFGGASSYCVVVEVSQVQNEGESATLSYEWDDSGASYDVTPNLNDVDRGTIPLVLGLVQGGQNTASYITGIYDKAGLSEAIINIYMLPKSLIPSYHTLKLKVTVNGNTDTYNNIAVPHRSTGTYSLLSKTFQRPTSISNYIPKNKKLLTFPYCYFNISNNAGSSVPFHYEDFYSNDVKFNVEGTFGASGEIKAIPIGYKRMGVNDNSLDYSINGAKYPICSWNSDSYTNWLTQNAVNMETQWRTTILHAGISTIGGAIAGFGMGGVVGASMGAISGAVESGGNLITLAREQHLAKTQANLVPDQAKGNLGAGDFLWAKYRSPFSFIPMCIKREYAECIDEYFSQFGYKCNRVKIPNITGRRNWNYVKTVGCYIEGDIPQKDMQEIKNLFDSGITLWHNPAFFCNYGADNDII